MIGIPQIVVSHACYRDCQPEFCHPLCPGNDEGRWGFDSLCHYGSPRPTFRRDSDPVPFGILPGTTQVAHARQIVDFEYCDVFPSSQPQLCLPLEDHTEVEHEIWTETLEEKQWRNKLINLVGKQMVAHSQPVCYGCSNSFTQHNTYVRIPRSHKPHHCFPFDPVNIPPQMFHKVSTPKICVNSTSEIDNIKCSKKSSPSDSQSSSRKSSSQQSQPPLPPRPTGTDYYVRRTSDKPNSVNTVGDFEHGNSHNCTVASIQNPHSPSSNQKTPLSERDAASNCSSKSYNKPSCSSAMNTNQQPPALPPKLTSSGVSCTAGTFKPPSTICDTNVAASPCDIVVDNVGYRRPKKEGLTLPLKSSQVVDEEVLAGSENPHKKIRTSHSKRDKSRESCAPPPPPPFPPIATSPEAIPAANSERKSSCSSTGDSTDFMTARKDFSSFRFTRKAVSPAVYKHFMENHFEQLERQRKARMERHVRLEAEMTKMALEASTQEHFRQLLKQKETNYLRERRQKLSRDQFVQIAILGIGAFGKVSLVRKKDTGRLFAMKRLQKREVVERKQAAHVTAERDILAEADSQWVVKLYYSFQDERHLYFVMDYIPGGDLMSLLIKKGIFEEDLARFYIAELTLSLESVHNLGFIHRDIKPDNILITREGHIKLTDFGLSHGFRWTHMTQYYQNWDPKLSHCPQESVLTEGDEELNDECVVMDDDGGQKDLDRNKPLHRRWYRFRYKNRKIARSLVGTPNYIAPEILRRQPYSQQCDWWSVGVILYEMVVGQPPFLAASPLDTQHKVVNWRRYLRIPERAKLQPSTRELIIALCCDPEDRLCCAEHMRKHPYFEGIDWVNLDTTAAPYVPELKHALDLSNFDQLDESLITNSDEMDAEASVNKDAEEPVATESTACDTACMTIPSSAKTMKAVASGNLLDNISFPYFTFKRFFVNGASTCGD